MSDATSTRRVDPHADDAARWDPPATLHGTGSFVVADVAGEPAETRVTCHYLFAPGTVAAPDFDPTEVVDFRHELALQDWAVCENAQRGPRSRGYAQGGVLPYADRYLHTFHKEYKAMLNDTPSPRTEAH